MGSKPTYMIYNGKVMEWNGSIIRTAGDGKVPLDGLVAYWDFEDGSLASTLGKDISFTLEGDFDVQDGMRLWTDGDNGDSLRRYRHPIDPYHFFTNDNSTGRIYINDPSIGQYLESPEEFTLSLWFKPSTFQSGDRQVIFKFDNGQTVDTWYSLFNQFIEQEYILEARIDGGDTTSLDIPWPNKPYTWQHIVAHYNGSHLSIFINDVSVGAMPWTNYMPDGSTTQLGLGCTPTNWKVEETIEGNFDKVYYYGRALSRDEISDLYYSVNVYDYPTYSTDSLYARWDFQNTMDSSIGRTITLITTDTTYESGVVGDSLKSDSPTGFTYTLDSSIVTLLRGTDDYAISLWYKGNDASVNLVKHAFQFANTNDLGPYDRINILYNTATDGISYQIGSSITLEGASDTVYVNNTNNWHHVILSRSSGDVSFWVDGSLASINEFVGPLSSFASRITVASRSEVPTYDIDCNVDLLYIYNRSLTSQDVSTLWNEGMGRYTTPY